MNSRKSPLKQLKEPLLFALSIVIIVFCVYSCSFRRGFWSTLPLVSLGSAAIALFYYSPVKILSVSAVCALGFSLTDGAGVTYALIYTAAVCLAVFFSMFSVRLVIKHVKKPLCWLLALLIFTIAPVAQAFVFSTPFQNVKMQRFFDTYLSEKYPDQQFSSVTPYYDALSGKYCAELKFNTNSDTQLFASLESDGENITSDGFFKLLCERGLEKRKSEFVNLIRTNYPDALLSLECNSVSLEPQNAESFSGSFGTVPGWLKENADLLVGFKFSLADNKAFLDTAKEYFTYITDAGFEFSNITFLGGDQGTYTYSLTVSADTPLEDFASNIKRCKISMEISSISLEYSYLY